MKALTAEMRVSDQGVEVFQVVPLTTQGETGIEIVPVGQFMPLTKPSVIEVQLVHLVSGISLCMKIIQIYIKGHLGDSVTEE